MTNVLREHGKVVLTFPNLQIHGGRLFNPDENPERAQIQMN